MCSKYYTFRILQNDDETSLSYCKKFNSLSVLLTYIIRNYKIEDLDKYNFDDFDITTRFTSSDDGDDGDDGDKPDFTMPVPRISDLFNF